MDKNQSEDIEESFEIYDPIVNSISDSMSIVPIPEPMDSSNGQTVQPSNSGSNSFANLQTKRIESVDGLPTYEQIQETDMSALKLSSNSSTNERNDSLQKLSDNLSRIEDNVKNCSNQLETVLTTNLEIYLKELRDENEKLKAELERNNHFMKQQLKKLQEVIEQNKEVVQQKEVISQENHSLKGENERLKDKVSELEGMTGLVEQLTAEVQTLQSKTQSMANYEKFDIPSELRNQELNARLVESQQKIDAMTAEINILKNELSSSNSRLDTLPAMESQLYLYERDFKIEELAKMAALKREAELEEELDRLKQMISQMEERMEKGSPSVELKDDSVKTHHRRSRRSGRLGRHGIHVPSVGAVLKGFKQYKTTSNDV